MNSRLLKTLPLLVVAIAACVFASIAVAGEKPASFIARRSDKLFDGDKPYRFISFNIPNLMVQEDAYEFTKPNPWRWPDEFEIEDALESVRQMGGQVVRTYVLSVHRDGSDMGDVVHVVKPGEFNEEGFRALDKVVEVAKRKGIRVIIPFVDQAKWWGGIGEYAAFRGKRVAAFWSDPQVIADFKATIKYLLERKNVYTGVAYRDEPAIFGWETGNEILPTPEWTREIAAYIKELDKNHIVIDGKSLKGVPMASLDDPNIDVITTHQYPFGEDHDFAKQIHAAREVTKGKKAYFVGEFGFVEMPHIASAIQEAIDDGSSGALLWSLRMHRREGGFYWHMETGTGKNIYKAFHWPGFDSGERYDEKVVMSLVRDKACEIRGEKPPAIEQPTAPKLLPIEKASAISWQGSAGASSYDVWRSESPNGEWKKIAEKVSDAEVQYRPLFNDETAKPGNRYSYRIMARNSAGESEPSNVVELPRVECRTLVDECRDLSLTASTAGKVAPASENARTVQEDCHRLAMEPGSAVIYRAPGPISNWTVYTFARGEPKLDVSVSNDGKEFRPMIAKSRAYSSGQTVYGYSTPALTVGSADGGATYLRIAVGDTSAAKESDGAKPPLGRELGAERQAAGVELSRVEIEYDRVADEVGTPTKGKETSHRKAAQLNSSVFVYTGRPIEPTLAAIDEAAAHGERKLNVVVTVLVDLTDDFHIKSFGSFSRDGFEYTPYDDAMRATLREKLRQVFARMVEHHMAIAVLPHIDCGGKVRTWRNWVDFDPLESYSGDSYGDLVLGTIADELAATVTPETPVEIALSGEMGSSLFKDPESYRKIVEQLRARPKLKQLKIGISLNHDKLAGDGNPKGAKEIQLSDEQRKQMQALIDECDFVGVSAYFVVSATPSIDDFLRGIDKFMSELATHGLRIPKDKPIEFSEVGIGGQQMRRGVVDLEKAIQSPWEGTAEARNSPRVVDSMRDLRREYHIQLTKLLATQPAPWRISSAFIWSMGSWDPWGHGEPAFADSEIEKAIEKHNRAVSGE